jgi:hypothetical protein
MIIDAARERDANQNRFLAALKGIDLGEDKAAEDDRLTVDEIKKRVAAKAAGVPEEMADLGGMFGFEEDEEQE